jgi:hypothetical protein
VVRELRAVGEVSEKTCAGLAAATRLDTLEDVLRWGADVLDVIVQDEYTHDVVTRDPTGVILVFDTT